MIKKDYLIINANHQASYEVSAAGDKRNEINGQKRMINYTGYLGYASSFS